MEAGLHFIGSCTIPSQKPLDLVIICSNLLNLESPLTECKQFLDIAIIMGLQMRWFSLDGNVFLSLAHHNFLLRNSL